MNSVVVLSVVYNPGACNGNTRTRGERKGLQVKAKVRIYEGEEINEGGFRN